MSDAPLKLRVEDADDLQIAATCLQDAIVPLVDMRYLRDQRRFVLVLNRFQWEKPSERVDGTDVYGRRLVLLSIETVSAVHVRGIDQTARDQMLELLTIVRGDGHIELVFAGRARIRLDVDRIQCRLRDLDESWPTRWRPEHPVDEQGSEPASTDRKAG